MVIVESCIEQFEVFYYVVLVLLNEVVQDLLLLVVLLLKVLIKALVLESDFLLLSYVRMRFAIVKTPEESFLLFFLAVQGCNVEDLPHHIPDVFVLLK